MPPRDLIRLVDAASVITPVLIRCVADIKAQPVRWLWEGRIARGKVTMLAGHPGLGKSQLALAVAAIVTGAARWPVDGNRAERGNVIILSAEDDPADTIRPRLEAADADLTRCHVIDAVQDIGDDGKPRRRGFSLVEDIARLRAELQRIGDVALVIIDPITAYLGATDSHRNAEVRAVLVPLGELAAQHSVAVLAISHLRKSLAGDAVLQVTGSLAFAAAARAVYIVARDPDDSARRLMLPAKNNIGDDRTGYAYRIEPISLANGIGTSRPVWEPGLVTVTADEALATHERGNAGAPPKRNAAAQWLAGILGEGPVAVSELRREAEAAGYSWATVRRAHNELDVTAEKTGYDDGWAWRLPETPLGAEIEL
jgi:putative DNA primase/helicase